MVQARSETTREKVLEAATELVVELGHENVSMKDLVERSGVSNGSIFHHFGSKDGVLEEIFARERREYLSFISRATLEYDGDPCDAVAAASAAAIIYQARDPQRHFRLISQFSHSEWLYQKRQMWNDLAGDIERPVVEWAMPHLATGRLPMLPPAMIQSLLLGSAELICHQWRAGRIGGKLEDHAPTVAQFVGAGLKHLRDLGAQQSRE